MTRTTREIVHIDERGRSYLAKLGFGKGTTVIADRVEGEESVWIIRPGRIVTDAELQILATVDNLESLRRAAAELLAGDETVDLA